MLSIVRVESGENLDLIRALLEEYAAEWPGLDAALQAQHFAEELANLPGEYAPPAGRLLLAVHDGQAAGCVALRKLGGGACEMKRLYVRPQYRGLKVGRALAETVVGEARRLGYAAMHLDTVPPMEQAKALYESLGFREIPAYYYNPIASAIFMELTLS